MKILTEADKSHLKEKYKQHHQADLINGVALGKRYCYLAELAPEDFKSILINSDATGRSLLQKEYPSLWMVIEQIRADPSYLKSTRQDGGINGVQVNKYLELFATSGLSLGDSMILDRDMFPDMNSAGRYYVIDGMHRLVAYGLATNMDPQYFPVQIYYCSDRKP